MSSNHLLASRSNSYSVKYLCKGFNFVSFMSCSGETSVGIIFFSKMKCFKFSSGDKKEEHNKTPKSVSLTSNFSDRDINRSGSDFNSRDASGTSTESSMGRKNSYPSMSARESNLREFSVTDLKAATKNFSRSVMIGEGGFGCVFRGTVRDLEDPSIKIEVAVKQLGKRGLQASL